MAKQSNAWKDFERRVAKDLGGVRGGPTGFTTPDVIGLPVPFAPECKYMQTLSLRKAHVDQARKNARGKPWGLFLQEAKTSQRLVVLEYETFLTMWDAYTTEKKD